MRWSSILNSDKDLSDAEVTVLSYTPKTFDLKTSEAVGTYLDQKELGSDFVMSDVLRKTTGVEEIERQTEEQKIEEKVLEKISVLQEEAYKTAYDLGFEQGLEKAIEEKTNDLEKKIQNLEDLVNSILVIKGEMVHQNEAHVMKMIYEIASRLAFDHVKENDHVVLQLIKKTIEQAQADEKVNVLVAPEQLEFLEKTKQSQGREFDFLKKVKLEPSEQVTVGGCIVETNYGVIDARVEERVEKLWNEIKLSLPKVKTSIESA